MVFHKTNTITGIVYRLCNKALCTVEVAVEQWRWWWQTCWEECW